MANSSDETPEEMLPLHMATNTSQASSNGDDQAKLLERQGGPSRSSPSVVRHAEHFYEGSWLPLHRQDGTLPPHFGERMILKHPCSPYPVEAAPFARIFGTSVKRRSLLEKLFAFRRDLRTIGIRHGFQWVGGSMVERRETEPSDVDMVTFFVLPDAWKDGTAREEALRSHPDLFDKERARAKYACDAYLIQLGLKRDMFRHLTLWSSLFGHERDTNLWKGFCELDLATDDEDASALAALVR